MRIVSIAFGMAALLLLAAMPAGAIQESDAIIPNPELCTLEPSTRERLDAIVAMPFVPATPIANAGAGTPVAMPEGGAPVPRDVQASIEESMIINIACINTGDPLRQMSIYTDLGLLRLLGEGVETITDEQFAMLTTPDELAEEDYTVIYEFGEAVDLGDGRVAIVIVGDDQSQPDPASPTLFVLVDQDGHWAVDSFESTQD